MKVKIFTGFPEDPERLEKELNYFLASNKVMDIKYSSAYADEVGIVGSVLVMYEEK